MSNESRFTPEEQAERVAAGLISNVEAGARAEELARTYIANGEYTQEEWTSALSKAWIRVQVERQIKGNAQREAQGAATFETQQVPGTFGEYLLRNKAEGKHQFSIGTYEREDGKVHFFIHPTDTDGQTLDFLVSGNTLEPHNQR